MRLEDYCELEFAQNGPFWHLCTPGDWAGVLFREREDYLFGMNAVSLAAAEMMENVRILTFQIMSNHIHFVLLGEYAHIESFFCTLRKRIVKYLSLRQRSFEAKGLNPKIFKVGDLKYLRNVLAYVNRNGYVADRGNTPFSYPWGANPYFFNPLMKYEEKQYLTGTTIEAKRKMFSSRNYSHPENYYITRGHISPSCYCSIDTAESMFRDAHQYFNLVSRQVEAFSSIAQELGDRITFTDEEIYYAVTAICRKEYNADAPYMLGMEGKFEMARKMHYDFNASNKQIRRILRLDEHVVDSMFPRSINGKL